MDAYVKGGGRMTESEAATENSDSGAAPVAAQLKPKKTFNIVSWRAARVADELRGFGITAVEHSLFQRGCVAIDVQPALEGERPGPTPIYVLPVQVEWFSMSPFQVAQEIVTILRSDPLLAKFLDAVKARGLARSEHKRALEKALKTAKNRAKRQREKLKGKRGKKVDPKPAGVIATTPTGARLVVKR